MSHMLTLIVKVQIENVMNGFGHLSVWMRRIAKFSVEGSLSDDG